VRPVYPSPHCTGGLERSSVSVSAGTGQCGSALVSLRGATLLGGTGGGGVSVLGEEEGSIAKLIDGVVVAASGEMTSL
jgi:hypothetical protein